MNQNKKRVTLNRRNSSLILDYQATVPSFVTSSATDHSETQTTTPLVTNEYTHQLVASALSLPSSVNITTTAKVAEASSPVFTTTNSTDKKIELPFLLKSSLRNPTKSASAPCSPTTGIKSVKFNTHQLEEICLFRKAQTPLAISQKNIFWGEEDDDEEESSNESSSEGEEEEEEEKEIDTKPTKTLVYANWPTRLSDILDKKNKMIRIEKNTIKLDEDFDQIIGKILVKNLDYHKTVTIRYTFDFWETIDNTSAKYHPVVQQQDHKNNYDVFTFKLKLPPSAITLYFAVRYKVGQQEYWDNNDGRNYEIQIKDSALEKKKSKVSSSTSAAVADVLNDSTPITKKMEDNNNNLKSRYDFSTSIHKARTITQEPSCYLQHKKTNSTSTIINNDRLSSSPTLSPLFSSKTNHIPFSSSTSLPITTTTTTTTTTIAMPIPIRRSTKSSSSSPTGLSCHSPIASSPIMDLNSQSYLELVNKYCFYSTSPSRSPMSIGG